MEANKYNFNEFKKLSEENERLTSQVADQDEQLISKHNIINALTKETEHLKYERPLLIQYNKNLLEKNQALTEQVGKLKKEKQDLQLAFNIMNDPGKELSRLREERKEYRAMLKEILIGWNNFNIAVDDDGVIMNQIQSLLEKFNDSTT